MQGMDTLRSCLSTVPFETSSFRCQTHRLEEHDSRGKCITHINQFPRPSIQRKRLIHLVYDTFWRRLAHRIFQIPKPQRELLQENEGGDVDITALSVSPSFSCIRDEIKQASEVRQSADARGGRGTALPCEMQLIHDPVSQAACPRGARDASGAICLARSPWPVSSMPA